MKKIYRYIKFHNKTALKNLTRHFGMTLSASIAVAITLILISIFTLMTANLTNFTYNIEDQITIRASIDAITSAKQVTQLEKDIKAIKGVKKVSFSSGNEELNRYKAEYADDASLFSMYDGKTSPIRDAFIIELQDGKQMEALSKQIGSMKGIVEANYGGESTDDLLAGFTSIREGGYIFIAFLVCIAIFLISNKIKMSIYTRKSEIAIMRFVGASNWCIRFPLMLEGTLIGAIGSIVPILLTIFGYQFLYQQLHGVLLTDMLLLKNVFPITLQVAVLLLGTGMLVGFVGSFLSTTRFLRWKR